MNGFDSLTAVLIWVATGGGAMFLWGYLEAYLLENVPAWHTLPTWVKVIFPILVAGLLGIMGQSLIATGVIAYIPPFLQVTLLAAINYLASQTAYLRLKTNGLYARKAQGGPQG